MKKGDLKRRFFIAVFPPDEIKKDLAEKVRQARASHSRDNSGNKDWEWKNSQDYHISLAFPGALGAASVARLQEILSEIRHPSFAVSGDGLNMFVRPESRGNRKRRQLHVLWAQPDPEGAQQLKNLHAVITAALQANGFDYGSKPIEPHITLAKPPLQKGDLMRAFARAHSGLFTGQNWLCDRFALCETLDDPEERLRNGGSRYRIVREFRLDAS